MTCPQPLTRSMYADGALAPAETSLLEQHLDGCAICQARIVLLRAERHALRAALQETDDAAPIPAFAAPSLGGREFAALVLGVAATAGIAAAFWDIAAAAVPSGLRWLNPLQSGELFERALNLITFVIYEGNAMWSNTIDFVGAALFLLLVAWGAAALARNRAGTAVLLSLLVVVLALPSLGHALEIRRGDLTTLAAGETVNDTLLAAGETVAIDGDVNGDLLAFGRSVTVRGNVTGDLITGGETVTIEGTIGGNVIGGGRAVTLAAARVGRNLYGFGRDIEINATSDIGGNAVTFGDSIDVDGRVGIDVKSFGTRVTISGNVLGDVEAVAERVVLLPSARVGGNLTVHMDEANELQVAPGAVVSGAVDRQADGEQERNQYLTVGYYGSQVVRLGAAFLTGLLLLWLFPMLRTLSLPDGTAALRTGGIGLITAVALPVAALLVCLTIVGIPIGIATFAIGAIGLYFAKAVVAQMIGRRLFRGPQGTPHYAATLLAGLAIVMIAINIPWIGGIIHLVVTLIGLGMIVTVLYARFNRREAL